MACNFCFPKVLPLEKLERLREWYCGNAKGSGWEELGEQGGDYPQTRKRDLLVLRGKERQVGR